MILLAAALLLVAVGLLAGGLAQGSSLLEWSSFGASALAALVLVLGEVRQRRRRRTARAAAAPSEGREPVTTVITMEPAEGGRPRTPPPTAEGVRPPRVLGPQTGRHGVPDPEPDVRPLDATPPVPPPAVPPVPPAVAAFPAEAPPPVVPPPAPVLAGEPPAEEVEFTDLLMIMDLTDEVFVIDEHPRYHLAGCPHVAGLPTIPVPMDQARSDGFTPCGICAPDRTLAARERARRGQ